MYFFCDVPQLLHSGEIFDSTPASLYNEKEMTKISKWWAIAIASVLALLVGLVVVVRGRRKSVAERERERRLVINQMGRITDGMLVESDSDEQLIASGLVFYRYNAKGLEYSAAQDISTLAHLTPPEGCLPGVPIQVKYHPQRPSDSIILCEQWSGLPSAVKRHAQVREARV